MREQMSKTTINNVKTTKKCFVSGGVIEVECKTNTNKRQINTF